MFVRFIQQQHKYRRNDSKCNKKICTISHFIIIFFNSKNNIGELEQWSSGKFFSSLSFSVYIYCNEKKSDNSGFPLGDAYMETA